MSLQSADVISRVYSGYPRIFKYFNKYCRKTIRVLVVGESGSGKSQFLSTLQNRSDFPRQRTTVTECIKLKLPNGRQIEFYDTPGHQLLKMERGKTLNELNRRKFDGIVNIVCYGYQEVEGVDPNIVFQGENVKESYLNENRKKELKQIEEWLGRIDDSCGIRWILTIINKADVWFDKSKEIMPYYIEGDYRHQLETVGRFIRLDVVPYCSVIAPYLDRPMRLLIGEKEKYALHLNFCKSISKLAKIEWLK